MPRISNNWFEFAGIRSDSKGLRMLALPDRVRPERRGEAVIVPGRDGTLWLPEDAYEDIELTVSAQLGATASRAEINAWLTGKGWLRFSDNTARAYKARAVKAYDYKHVAGMAGCEMLEIGFTCEPCAYAYPAMELMLANGGSVMNPGTRYAESFITIAGAGDVTLTIGGQTLNIDGLCEYESPITIDIPARVAYHENTNLCPKVSGDWPLIIQPGANAVSWTGTVSAVSMVPNWRYV
jgi:phage-related protein